MEHTPARGVDADPHSTSARKPKPSRRLKRRIALASVAVAATSAIGLGVTAAPASAARHDTCATARAAFRAAMNEARFWLGAADRLDAAGNTSSANAATNEANYYLGQAESALGDMANC
jgi:hypothetical protein